MNPVRITYDPEGDILYITFGQASAATGYQLSDQILLRIDPQTQKAAGLTIFNYSVHVQTGREVSLSRLEETHDKAAFLLSTLTSPPVSHFLRITQKEAVTQATVRHPSLQEAVACSL